MMIYSVSEAAKMVGMSRKTLYKHISEGRLSAKSDVNGNKTVDRAELLRVYGERLELPTENEKTPVESASSVNEEIARLEFELEKALSNADLFKRFYENEKEKSEIYRKQLSRQQAKEAELIKQHRVTLAMFNRLLPSKK